ncbi:MAG: CapA family protein [Clostridia bacterium]|nr:CapA family protein [Clostridia bacterium]
MRLIFGADLVPTSITEPAFVRGDAEAFFGDATRIFKGADRFIVNLECALTERDTAIKKIGPPLKASPKCTAGLLALGVTDACLANNHIYDFGEGGFRDTLRALDEAGISYTGVGENDNDSRTPHFFDIEDKRFAIINVNESEYSYALSDRCGVNPVNPARLMHDIRAAKALSDYTVVVYHGGKELCRYPSPRLYDLSHEMVRAGADVVLCQHSHCVGCYERFEGGHIVYGQGNFNFMWDTGNECWTDGLAVEVQIENNELSLVFHPLVTNFDEGRVELAAGERAREILSGFLARSEELKTGEWRRGWREFCESVAPIYNKVVREALSDNPTEPRANEFFAHYIDCEAHLDVLKELFQTWNRTVKQ